MQLRAIVTPAKLAVPQKVAYTGQAGNIEVTSGKTLKIETTPGGGEILETTVPAGKKWTVYVKVEIQESDV